MNEKQWNIFLQFRNEFKAKCNEWKKFENQIFSLVKEVSKKDTPEYPLENAVVYNSSLDEITKESEIKLIVIGDNPGKNEQLNINQKYLVGQSGKLATSYFSKNGELKIDFRKNVIILNKTPVHTAKTKHLSYLLTNGSFELKKMINESQLWMAEKTARLHIDLLNAYNISNYKCELWLVGYSELKTKGIFSKYKEKLEEEYINEKDTWQKVYVYPHFSMNCFNRDLNEFKKNNSVLSEKSCLEILGRKHRIEIFNH